MQNNNGTGRLSSLYRRCCLYSWRFIDTF